MNVRLGFYKLNCYLLCVNINTSQVNIGIKPNQLLLKVNEVSDDYFW